MDSSCARQPQRMKELWEAGCQMKLLKPKGGGFARMHVKSLIIDERVVLTGSVNMTHSGHENNKEHMYRITEPTAVSDVLADFEKDWGEAELLTQQLINTMLENSEKHRRSREKSRSVSRSLSQAPAVSRTLSAELDDAAHPDDECK